MIGGEVSYPESSLSIVNLGLRVLSISRNPEIDTAAL